MKYTFHLTAEQLQLVVAALRTKSNELNLFSDALIRSATMQEEAAKAAQEEANSEEPRVEEVQAEESQETE